MEFAQRGTNQTTTNPMPGHSAGHTKSADMGKNKLITLLMLVSTGVLLVSLIFYAVTGNTLVNNREVAYVAGGQYQAVFLNGGQVYFGQVTNLNTKYLRLQDIYYLRVNQTVQPNQASSAASNDVSLVKLGCELHGPTDAMLINRDQVIFWENLKTDGQVAKAVAEYKKQNPNGQKCDTTATTTPAPTTTTTKK